MKMAELRAPPFIANQSSPDDHFQSGAPVLELLG
jgi:hypothetical protein